MNVKKYFFEALALSLIEEVPCVCLFTEVTRGQTDIDNYPNHRKEEAKATTFMQ